MFDLTAALEHRAEVREACREVARNRRALKREIEVARKAKEPKKEEKRCPLPSSTT